MPLAPPWSLTTADIRKLLDAIPSTPVGLRDRAIILTLTFTGRPRTDVLNLNASDLIQDGEAVYYSYRGNGGKHGKQELPQPAFRAVISHIGSILFNLGITVYHHLAGSMFTAPRPSQLQYCTIGPRSLTNRDQR